MTFKPCSDLTAEDFQASALWGFDLSGESGISGADETWVRPYVFRTVPRDSDMLFAAATIWANDEAPQAGAVTFRFESRKPVVDSCVVLTPKYCSIGVSLTKDDSSYLKWAMGNEYKRRFPLRYEAVISVGKSQFTESGTIELPASIRG